MPNSPKPTKDQVKTPDWMPPPDPNAAKEYLPVGDAERALIRLSRIDPFIFIAYVSGKIPAAHHVRWLKKMFDWSDPANLRLAFIAPRESAKSTITVLAMAWFISRYPWKTNAIMSVSKDQAEKRMGMIKGIIENDTRFRNVFPWINIDYRMKNTQSEFTIVSEGLYDESTEEVTPLTYALWRATISRYGSLKDPTLRTGGRGSKNIIGGRISGMLLLDDIIDDADVNPLIQEEVYNYLMMTVIPLLQETAKCIFIGTRWMNNDVPEMIMNNPAWTSETIVALTPDPKTGQLVSYWPEYWPVARLLAKKREMDNDAIFEVMYQNNPRALAQAKFKLTSLDQGLPYPLPVFRSIYVGSDFAASLKMRADWTVYAAVGFDFLNNIYILDMQRMKAPPDELMTFFGEFCKNTANTYGRLDKVLIEKTNFQTWAEPLVRAKFPGLPTDLVPPVGDKGHRLEPLAVKFNDGQGYINKKMAEYPTFKSEALNFPNGHDDTLDAVTIILAYLGVFASGGANVKNVVSEYLT